jgi:hypothetical protein
MIDVDSDSYERIAYLAYFCFETHEEYGGDGDSRIFKIINPAAEKISWIKLRSVILGDFISQQHMSVTEAAIATAKWLCSIGTKNYDTDYFDRIRFICRRYEYAFTETRDLEDIYARRRLRLVRLLWLIYAHNVRAHSRVAAFFFADSEICIGRSDDSPVNGSHPEHIVPCAYIRTLILERFRDRPLVIEHVQDDKCALDMCHLINRLLKVAYISQEHRKYLDTGLNAMKHTMPPSWNPETGDILDRLRHYPEFSQIIPLA